MEAFRIARLLPHQAAQDTPGHAGGSQPGSATGGPGYLALREPSTEDQGAWDAFPLM